MSTECHSDESWVTSIPDTCISSDPFMSTTPVFFLIYFIVRIYLHIIFFINSRFPVDSGTSNDDIVYRKLGVRCIDFAFPLAVPVQVDRCKTHIKP